MAISAGQRVTAGHFAWHVKGVELSSTAASASSTWEPWGTETIEIADPGVPVAVQATVSGRFLNNTTTSSAGTCRVAVSLDGGGTWFVGNMPTENVGTSIGERGAISAECMVSGTPSGNIIVKAEQYVADLNAKAQTGYLTAVVIPD